MSTYPIRADWWREVTDPNEIIPAGCPTRWEPRHDSRLSITETVQNFDRNKFGWGVDGDVFIDSRWTPPRPVYKVGDVIENAKEAKYLPDGSVFIDCDGDAWQMRDGKVQGAYGDRYHLGDSRCLPLTVIYVPKAGG